MNYLEDKNYHPYWVIQDLLKLNFELMLSFLFVLLTDAVATDAADAHGVSREDCPLSLFDDVQVDDPSLLCWAIDWEDDIIA